MARISPTLGWATRVGSYAESCAGLPIGAARGSADGGGPAQPGDDQLGETQLLRVNRSCAILPYIHMS